MRGSLLVLASLGEAKLIGTLGANPVKNQGTVFKKLKKVGATRAGFAGFEAVEGPRKPRRLSDDIGYDVFADSDLPQACMPNAVRFAVPAGSTVMFVSAHTDQLTRLVQFLPGG